jgi:hypothetical protein
MGFIQRYKTALAFIVILVLLFFGYEIFLAKPAQQQNSGSSSAQVIGAQILSMLAQIKTISLDGSVLHDSRFAALRDLSPALVPQPVGRRNPFAPIGVGGAPVNTGSSTSSR